MLQAVRNDIRCGRETAIDGLRERKSAQARAATLEAGFRLFDERGYDQVTVADICAAADIGRRTFFHYFPTKEDLLGVPAREMGERLTATLEGAPPEATDSQTLRAAMTELATYTLAHRSQLELYRRIITTSTTLRHPAFWHLPAHELRVAQQLSTRQGRTAGPTLETRLLVVRTVAAFRLWLEVTLEGDAPDTGEDDTPALRLLDEIFDADPWLVDRR